MIRPKPKPVKTIKIKRRKKKTNKQVLELKADRLVREIVLIRDRSCVCPPPKNGHSAVMQPGHLISRGKKSLRWDLRNVHCQCSSCNLTHEFAPERYTQWFIEEFGAEEYAQLVKESMMVLDTYGVDVLEKIIIGLEITLDVIKKNKDTSKTNIRNYFYPSQLELIGMGGV